MCVRESVVPATRALLLLVICAAVATCATAAVTPRAQDARAAALEFVRAHAADLGVTPADVEDVIVTSDTVSAHTGVSHVYLRQRYRGIDIWGADLTVNVGRDGRVVSHAGRFVARLSSGVERTPPRLTPIEAAEAAARHLELRFTRPVRLLRPPAGAASAALLSDGGIAATSIPVRLVFFPAQPERLRLAWLVEIEERRAQHWWVALIDAETGALLEKSDRIETGAVQVR